MPSVTRVEKAPGEVVTFGPFRLFPTARLLERDNRPAEIGGRALDVLIELVKRAGRVVSKAELLSAIWADTTVVEGVLRTHVYGLRKALGDGVAGARYVTSVAGRGYCFVAPVVRSVAESTTPASSSTRKVPHGLPMRLARMAGRDDDVRILSSQLAEHRFVTVLGAAGIGKTTLAVAVGHALLDDFGGAVRFIELGSLTDPGLLAATVASMLEVPIQADDALESLRAFLHDKRILLVLDNCEHVIDAAARLTELLFSHAPNAYLLTTSREALRVEGEHVYRLVPLETPGEPLRTDADAVVTFPAVQVFLERAAASGWSGELTDEDARVVAETCSRLDGVPLALELAASFVGQYGLRGVAALLDDRLRLLWQRGRRTAPPRQQTIHALIAWSYDRLPEPKRVVLRRLSVLAGAFAFDTAKAVALAEGDSVESLLEVMNELVAKSLLSFSVEDGAVVYRLLETTRVYGLERLAESGELEHVSFRHAQFFAELLERTPEATGRGSSSRQASALANVRAALEWSFSSPRQLAVSVRLTAAVTPTLLDLGFVSECHRWCSQALGILREADASALVELRVQEGFALSAIWAGSNRGVRPALDRALALAAELGEGDDQVRLLEHLNFLLQRTGNLKEALEVAEQSVAAARTATTTAACTAEWMLARSHYMSGNQILALEHCEAGLRLAEASGEPSASILGHSVALLCLARVLWLRGRVERALALARELVHESNKQQHPVHRCIRLVHCAPIVAWHGEWEEVQKLVDQLIELSERHSLRSYRTFATAIQGKLLVDRGQPEEGSKLLKAAASALNAAQTTSLDTFFACGLGEGLAATGAVDEALVTVSAGIELAQRRGGTWDLPELLRLKAVFLASQPTASAQEVDELLCTAIELAQRQGALTWELRATTTLFRQRLRRPGTTKMVGDLRAVYAKFTEGMQAPDLQTARRLLEGRDPRSAAHN
ncbi:MAG TPA: winged helix-turn-helix domain-containing protein [Polyangiaceae bacterium]|jgi:predicted ATPase/DNA-binding winged helix-turn-helix (wHTH) protein|nr:winged helix-turn-helix domain-containing protein [Polyangiaceae bacterium]